MDKKKKYFTAGIVLFGLSIIFAVIFIWTLDVYTEFRYFDNFVGSGRRVVTYIDHTGEDFQVIWGVLSILSVVSAVAFTITALWTPDTPTLDNF